MKSLLFIVLGIIVGVVSTLIVLEMIATKTIPVKAKKDITILDTKGTPIIVIKSGTKLGYTGEMPEGYGMYELHINAFGSDSICFVRLQKDSFYTYDYSIE